MTGLTVDPLDPAVVPLREGRTVLGAGFLVAPGVVATCAHVVGRATPVADFPLLRGHDHAVEVLSQDDDLDVAILRLADTPPGALPVPARRPRRRWSSTCGPPGSRRQVVRRSRSAREIRTSRWRQTSDGLSVWDLRTRTQAHAFRLGVTDLVVSADGSAAAMTDQANNSIGLVDLIKMD
ncbi:trypsin-like peptidase domain-containing protein [Saccharopolyspora spinosa]|uniref:Trypsin-like peptidase n=1 Tax=Saccharopolyspora spinosa TaxID=60894 RepID=A0A2N3XPQ9_SACSN|nr:trypsin-like peptidase domain-containing protein [Saccharopolyspora spinosa]PKW12667.1 trypsin-like peptidase [Saccharopolyspora spinosa]